MGIATLLNCPEVMDIAARFAFDYVLILQEHSLLTAPHDLAAMIRAAEVYTKTVFVKINEVRKLLHAQPFRPFLIHVADGGRIPVKHEDFVALAPTGRELIVYLPDGDYQVLDLLLVTRLEVSAKNGARKPRK